MPSSWTDLDFELQAAGEHTNTWGAPSLNNLFTRATYAIGGYISIALTGDYTMTTVRPTTSMVAADFTARIANVKFTGSLGANATITVPGIGMVRWIYNATNKSVIITTGSGDTVTVETGDTIPVICDGTNVRTLSYGSYALKDYITAQTASAGAAPGVVGNAGKYLYTDGVSALWRAPVTADVTDFTARLVNDETLWFMGNF